MAAKVKPRVKPKALTAVSAQSGLRVVGPRAECFAVDDDAAAPTGERDHSFGQGNVGERRKAHQQTPGRRGGVAMKDNVNRTSLEVGDQVGEATARCA